MRVLYLCADPGVPLDGTKGASIHVRQTVGALARRGVEVTVLALRPGHPEALPARVLRPARRLGPLAPNAGRRLLCGELESVASARDLIARTPVARGDADVVYERYALWSLAGAVLSERLGAPLVLEVNAPLVEEQSRYRGLAMAEVASGIEVFLARRAAAVLCVSSPLRDRFSRLRGSGDGVHLFPNAVDTDLFRPHQRRGRKGLTVIFIGSLKPWHGLPVLIKAFARLARAHPAARLILAGEGPEREGLEGLAARLGVEAKVTFTGAVPHERVPVLLAAADIAVAPSAADADSYFSPLKLGEYLAAGLPVVVAARGDLTSLLREGESALLVPPGDAAALAQALHRLLTDPEMRLHLGEGGRNLAVRSLSLEASSLRLVRLLEEIRRGAAPRPDRDGAAVEAARGGRAAARCEEGRAS